MRSLWLIHFIWLAALATLAGCAAAPDTVPLHAIRSGDLGHARGRLKDKLAQTPTNTSSSDPSSTNRDDVINHLRLALLTLADGYAPPLSPAWDFVYSSLRTASLNRDKEAASILFNEDIKTWKGEPFEQALTYHYLGLHYALQNSWDNTRTAQLNAQLPLAPLGPLPGFIDTAAVMHAARTGDHTPLDRPQPERTTFALGYLLRAVAAQQLAASTGDPDRLAEARENFQLAAAIDPNLAALVQSFQSQPYNTLLLTDFGQGPRKIAAGPDQAVSSFKPVTPSTPDPLLVTLDNQTSAYPLVCDVNNLAATHTWNKMLQARLAKSGLGNVFIAAGVQTAAVGIDRDSPEAAYAGLSLLALGAFLKAGAHADARYCELFPQRIYAVPLHITAPNTTITLQIQNQPASRLVLTNINPPTTHTAQLLHARLLCPPPSNHDSSPAAPPLWATSGQTLYANDFAPDAGTLRLPYILGGDCVRSPTQQTLDSYHHAGFLKGMTLAELQNLYRSEGVAWEPQQESGSPGLHVLEAGSSLLCPHPGSLGYTRLFAQRHPPYQPRSQLVRSLQTQIQNQIDEQSNLYSNRRTPIQSGIITNELPQIIRSMTNR